MKRIDGKTYFIAEIGGNHEGNFDAAIDMASKAASAGADGVKFQIYTGETLVNCKEDEMRVKHFNNFALSMSQYMALADHCESLGVDFLSSIWSQDEITMFADRMPFIKVGSGDLTAYPILKIIAAVGKPILLSTGLATMSEVESAVSYITECNSYYNKPDTLGIMQCTSMYPIPFEDANLNVINTLKKNFPNTLIGYSDHTIGSLALKVAISMGVNNLEFHFTDEVYRTSFRDHQVSLTANMLAELREYDDTVHILKGDGIKRPMKSEIDSGHISSFRRALYYASDLKAGHVINADDLIALRPENGLSAAFSEDIIGQTLKVDVCEFDRVSNNNKIK